MRLRHRITAIGSDRWNHDRACARPYARHHVAGDFSVAGKAAVVFDWCYVKARKKPMRL